MSRQFAHGNPRYLAGLSGAELADLVVQSSGSPISESNDGSFSVGPEYWAGWALAFYQWGRIGVFHICEARVLA